MNLCVNLFDTGPVIKSKVVKSFQIGCKSFRGKTLEGTNRLIHLSRTVTKMDTREIF